MRRKSTRAITGGAGVDTIASVAEGTGRCSLQTIHERRNSEGGWMPHQQMDMIGLSIQSE
jgi:hypothetical protein